MGTTDKSSLKVPYAVKDGNLLHISEVESGLKCGCICPSCSARIVAKKGKVLEHHFAHEKGEGCKGGLETVLHMMAKTILEKERRITVPKVHILTKFTHIAFKDHDLPQEIIEAYVEGQKQFLAQETTIDFEKVELEKRLDDFVPDIALYKGTQCLLVEIRVSHGVDDDEDDVKLKKIETAGISLLEVDLSEYKGIISSSELKDILVDNLDNKHWIYNKKAAQYKKAWLSACDNLKPVMRKVSKEKFSEGKVYQIEDCPQSKRLYNNRPYANIAADCFTCEYCIHIEYEPHHYDDELDAIICVYCCGRNKIGNLHELKAYLRRNRTPDK